MRAAREPSSSTNLFFGPLERVTRRYPHMIFGRRGRTDNNRQRKRLLIGVYAGAVALSVGGLVGYSAWIHASGNNDLTVTAAKNALTSVRVATLAPPGSEARTARDRALPRWRRHAASWQDPSGRPIIAVVIDDVGLNQTNDPRVLGLPGPLTVALLPYGRNLRRLSATARANGHEVLIHLPMEPEDRHMNPGPRALLTGLSRHDLGRRIEWNLSRFSGYVGINNHMGSRFTSDRGAMELVIQAAAARGLIFVDSRTTSRSVAGPLTRQYGVPTVQRDVFLDNDRSRTGIRTQLAELERIARRTGSAVAIGHPHTITLNILEKWLTEATERGFVLVPITQIVARGTSPVSASLPVSTSAAGAGSVR